jgi:glycerate 2-kinase
MPDVLASLQKALLDCRGDHLVASFFLEDAQRDWFEEPWYAIALGKAAEAMMLGALKLGGHSLLSGLMVCKKPCEPMVSDQRIVSLCTSHPIPDNASLLAGQALLEFIKQLPNNARVLFLLSGGASALVECLPETLSLVSLQQKTQHWLAEGWDIQRINLARKELSLIKGGKLLNYFLPSIKILQLIIADVPNQDLASVGSGLLFGKTADGRVTTHCLADNQRLRQFIKTYLPKAKIHSDYVIEEVSQLAERIAAQAAEGQVMVWGGEPVVLLPADAPVGGRMQQLALSVAWNLRDASFPWRFIAMASDGGDGTTEDAGAFVDQYSISRAQQQGWCIESTLAKANAHALLVDIDALLHTGYTGTNVNDMMILSCEESA